MAERQAKTRTSRPPAVETPALKPLAARLRDPRLALSTDTTAAAAPLETIPELLARLDTVEPETRDAIAARLEAHPGAAAVLALVARHSPFLSQLIRRDPAGLLRLLDSDPTARLALARAEMTGAVATASSDEAVMAALRRLRNETALAVALADIGGAFDLDAVTAELTASADAAISAAVDHLLARAVDEGRLRPSGRGASAYTVLAMGKHGAGELNYSSDVDLIILFDPERVPLAADVEPGPFFVRLTRALVRLLQERTADGYVARIDLRLRPDPASTQIALSVESALTYYEREGATWERAAFIKARPVAGDRALGAQFLEQMAPFVWRRSLDYAAVADVHAMKQEIHAFRGHEAVAVEGHNVKLGRGGIREIEFFAQTQQLIAGGRDRHLRLPRTCPVLARLAEDGWIGKAARDELTEAYHYLRRVEHRLQMVADEQTHTLPDEPEALAEFAAFMGYPSRDAFAADLTRRLARVQYHYARLFEDAPPRAAVEGRLEFPAEADDRETIATLRKLGYVQPQEASATVRAWLSGEVRSLRAAGARERLATIVPGLLDALARGGDPDRALAAADRFFHKLPTGLRLVAALARNPDLVRLLSTILSTAPRLGDSLAQRPELFDALLDPAFFGTLPDEARLEARLSASLAEARDEEDVLDRARSFRQEQHVLIGARILSGTLPAAQAGDAFARLADVVIRVLGAHVIARFREAHGVVAGGEIAVLAMGKLGGREMTAGSDLDLIVLYDFDDEAPESDGARPLHGTQYYARLTQRLVNALTTPTNAGRLYEVDLRLRPSGRAGPVATRLSAFETYQASEAWTWEHMALTRARVVLASPDFRARVEDAIATVLRRPRDPVRIAADIVDMRGAIADEKDDSRPWDLKYVQGGLVDLEFLAQFLVLAHGAAHPELVQTSTARMLAAAGRAGVIEAEDAQALGSACALFHDLTQVLRLALADAFDPAQASPALRRLLARAGALPDFATLDAHLVETQRGVRAIFDRLLGVG